jgi:hypothetical protein
MQRKTTEYENKKEEERKLGPGDPYYLLITFNFPVIILVFFMRPYQFKLRGVVL